jgi:hypothetical protein
MARLHEQIEPALDRELWYRGVLSGDGAYTAELVTWAEGVVTNALHAGLMFRA